MPQLYEICLVEVCYESITRSRRSSVSTYLSAVPTCLWDDSDKSSNLSSSSFDSLGGLFVSGPFFGMDLKLVDDEIEGVELRSKWCVHSP